MVLVFNNFTNGILDGAGVAYGKKWFLLPHHVLQAAVVHILSRCKLAALSIESRN
jgi:hypothetical protein